MPEETKCPKCGAEAAETTAVFTRFRCDSFLFSDDFSVGVDRFDPSPSCEISTLRAALSKAVEALKPFAEIAKEIQPTLKDEHRNTMIWAIPTVGDLRRASTVLASLSTLTRAENGDL